MSTENQANVTCSQCQTGFSCGFLAGNESCWCFDYPHIMPVSKDNPDEANTCLCPDCLKQAILIRQNDKPLENGQI